MIEIKMEYRTDRIKVSLDKHYAPTRRPTDKYGNAIPFVFFPCEILLFDTLSPEIKIPTNTIKHGLLTNDIKELLMSMVPYVIRHKNILIHLGDE